MALNNIAEEKNILLDEAVSSLYKKQMLSLYFWIFRWVSFLFLDSPFARGKRGTNLQKNQPQRPQLRAK